jgi:hypothetical protein
MQSPSPPTPLISPKQYLPIDTERMKYPFKLTKKKMPFRKKNAAKWTEEEREKAEQGPQILTVEELRGYVSRSDQLITQH